MAAALYWTARNREKRATTEFALFLVTLLVWNGLQLAELLGGRMTAYYATFGIRVARAFMTVTWMYFTVTFAGYRHILDRWPARVLTAAGLVYLIVFTGVPSVAMAFTFDVAQFTAPTIVTYTTRGLTLSMAGVRLAGYGFVGFGILTLTYRLLYTGYAQRWQTMIFIAVTTGNVLLDLSVGFSVFPGVPGVDYAAVGTAFVALTLILTIYRSDLFEFIPVVRSHVVEHVDDAVIVLNPNKQVVDYNDTAEGVFTGPVTEGDDAAAVLPAAIVDAELLSSPTDGRTTITVETERGPVYYDMSVSEINAVGEVTGIAIILRDVTEQEQRRAELETKRRELTRKNDRLEEFANIVSHDLRTPLSVASGNLELARRETDSDHHDDVAAALDRMEAIIEDTLTLAREGQTVAETEPVEVGAVAEDCWETVATDGATIHVEGDRTVDADRGRLRHVFENLFRNAIEHGTAVGGSQTGNGSTARDGSDVAITVGFTDAGFYVADDGSGIPEGERESVFESGYSTNESGTGLGLPIVEEIVEAHGWDISVTESEAGGARFEITGVTPERPVE